MKELCWLRDANTRYHSGASIAAGGRGGGSGGWEGRSVDGGRIQSEDGKDGWEDGMDGMDGEEDIFILLPI